jgi:hypothetical protein
MTGNGSILCKCLRQILLAQLLVSIPAAWAQQAEPIEAPVERSADEDKTEAETDKPAEDPFDYQSSEEISEDLSVSFPVDI